MAVPKAYLTSTKNLKAIFLALRKAGVPDTFTYEFLKQLGFASSGDRPVISVMKALGMLDDGGRPTRRYRDYKDQRVGARVMATCMREAYSDVFAVDAEAQRLGSSDLNGLFARLSDKGDSVTQKMASTFRALVELADFDGTDPSDPSKENEEEGEETHQQRRPPTDASMGLSLRHDIHVHLPLSTDVAVYDAIFRSLKANLL